MEAGNARPPRLKGCGRALPAQGPPEALESAAPKALVLWEWRWRRGAFRAPG